MKLLSLTTTLNCVNSHDPSSAGTLIKAVEIPDGPAHTQPGTLGGNPTGGPGVRLGGGAPSWLQQGPLQAEPPTAALPLPPCAHIPVLLVPGNPALLPTLTAVGGAGFSVV